MLQYFSEGKGIVASKYLSEDYLFRWKKLERVIEKEGLDGLLIVTGLDGAESQFSTYLFNWLFLGLSGKSIYTNKYLDPVYSEMIVWVGVKESFIFVTPQAKMGLEHLLFSLNNWTVFCPTAAEYNDKELLDSLKITFFYRMMNKVKKLGVVLEPEVEPKSIEKWPIIQSYALEPVGKTFFTLKHETVNISQKILPLFKNLDKHSLMNLVSGAAYAMEGHIKGTTQLIEYTKSEERSAISESKLQECLQEAVDSPIEGQVACKASRVLYGVKTNNSKNVVSSSECTIANAKAFHMTIEHTDPSTLLQVWRTYFLNPSIKHQRVTLTIQEESGQTFLVKTKYRFEERENTELQDENVLLNIYLGLVQGVIDGIGTVSKDYRNLNKEFLLGHMCSKFQPVFQSLYKEKVVLTKEDIELEIESYDSMGDPKLIDFKDSVSFKLTSTYYVLKCRINNILATDGKRILGAVAFSQSFLLQQGCYLLLTKQIDYFDFWKTKPEVNDILEKLNPNYDFDDLGPAVSNEGFKKRLFVPLERLSLYHFNISVLAVKYYFHEKGLRIHSEKFGWIVLLYNDITDATMINKISGEWVLFKLTKPILFESFENRIIAIEFRGKPFEFLLKKINDKVKPLPLNFLDAVPPLLSQNWYFMKEILRKEVKEGAQLHQHQILQNDFLWSFIEAKQLMILNQMKDVKLGAFRNLYQQKIENKFEQVPVPGDKHSLLIINGTYGTNKEKLAQTITKFGPANYQYSIFSVPYQNLYARMELTTYLQCLNEFIADQPISIANHIIIVILPSWLNSATAIPSLSQKYHIRSVVCQISCGNFFASKNHAIVENVMTFALPGYAQTIVLDRHGEAQSMIDTVMKILWSFNKEAQIFRASNSMLSTGQCTDIVKNNYYGNEYQKFLRVKYGSLYKFDALAELSVNYLQFKFPIFDLPLLKGLSKTNGYIINLAAILQQLQPKKDQAKDSKDQLMLSLYNLEQSITVWKRKEQTTQICELHGTVKVQNEQGLFEIEYANLQYREKNVPETPGNNVLGFFILSRNYDQQTVRNFFESLSFKKYALQGLQQKRTEASLTEQQRKTIQKQGRNRYLQHGQFYDGYFFREISGYILPQHPNLDRLVAEWLEQTNAGIELHNSKIREEWSEYAKQYK